MVAVVVFYCFGNVLDCSVDEDFVILFFFFYLVLVATTDNTFQPRTQLSHLHSPVEGNSYSFDPLFILFVFLYTRLSASILMFHFSLYLNTKEQSLKRAIYPPLSLCSLSLAITGGNLMLALNCIFNLYEERAAEKKPAELRGFILRVSEEHYVALFRPEAQQDALAGKL